MHNAGYAYLGIDATYEFLPTSPDNFGRIVAKMNAGELDGVNVTMPHKQHAFMAADVLDARALRLGAANTLVALDDGIRGYNTDVDGVEYALYRLGLSEGTPVHILGSGGAAAAALLAVHRYSPISISSRTAAKASALCDRIGVDATVRPWGEPVAGAILLNATPLGMDGESLPDGALDGTVGFIEMAYGPIPTPASVTAARLSIPCTDGLVMLAGQAGTAFSLFTSSEVPISVLEAAARAR